MAKKSSRKIKNFTEEEKEKRYQYNQERKKKLPDSRTNYYLANKK